MSHAAAKLERFDGAQEAPVAPPDRTREYLHRQMLSTVAHDLKTPLASIIGSLEVYTQMKDRLSEEKQATLVNVALQEARRLDGFIANILDMAKLENGLVTAKPDSVEIGAMLRNCISHMKHAIPEGAADVQGTPGAVKADIDSMLLSRVVCLVLDNAAKHAGPSPVIRVAFGKGENHTGTISIRDNGPGLPEGCLETVFEKYARHAGEDGHNKGMGLGLPIAREIMRLLNGRIVADNHPDGGAVFTLNFPLERPL